MVVRLTIRGKTLLHIGTSENQRSPRSRVSVADGKNIPYGWSWTTRKTLPSAGPGGGGRGDELGAMTSFHIEIIKPSHYDKDGYVIQWWKAWIPSNSMASLYAIAQDCAERKVLGDGVAIEVDAYDEMKGRIPIEQIVRRIRQPGHKGLVCLVGVQSNQIPRAMVIARQFRAKGVAVAIGGFHVSGCVAMLKELTPELKEAVDLGVILYAGEAEEHFDARLRDVHRGEARPIYKTMDDLPSLQEQTIPYLPRRLVARYDGVLSSFDAGRGCPFQCSFCTIIDVQGRKSRYRSADDVERIVRGNASRGMPIRLHWAREHQPRDA